MAHLNGAGDQNFVVNAPTLAACPAADPAFVQLVENLKSCLILRDPNLALQLDSRHAADMPGVRLATR
jgi:hypothetical protein